MSKILKKNSIQVPHNTAVFYCNRKKILIIIGPIKTKSAIIDFKLELTNDNKTIYITSKMNSKLSNTKKKN